LRWIASVF